MYAQVVDCKVWIELPRQPLRNYEEGFNPPEVGAITRLERPPPVLLEESISRIANSHLPSIMKVEMGACDELTELRAEPSVDECGSLSAVATLKWHVSARRGEDRQRKQVLLSQGLV